jgi:hypothetical protein
MGDRQAPKDLGERFAVVDSSLGCIVAILGVEVETQQAKLSAGIGQANAPGRARGRRTQAV